MNEKFKKSLDLRSVQMKWAQGIVLLLGWVAAGNKHKNKIQPNSTARPMITDQDYDDLYEVVIEHNNGSTQFYNITESTSIQ